MISPVLYFFLNIPNPVTFFTGGASAGSEESEALASLPRGFEGAILLPGVTGIDDVNVARGEEWADNSCETVVIEVGADDGGVLDCDEIKEGHPVKALVKAFVA
jgi:hypothetical protein